MATKKPTPKPTIGQRIKKAVSTISDELNPEKRFGPAAQRQMKKARGDTDSMISPATQKRRIDRAVDSQTSRTNKKPSGRRYS